MPQGGCIPQSLSSFSHGQMSQCPNAEQSAAVNRHRALVMVCQFSWAVTALYVRLTFSRFAMLNGLVDVIKQQPAASAFMAPKTAFDLCRRTSRVRQTAFLRGLGVFWLCAHGVSWLSLAPAVACALRSAKREPAPNGSSQSARSQTTDASGIVRQHRGRLCAGAVGKSRSFQAFPQSVAAAAWRLESSRTSQW